MLTRAIKSQEEVIDGKKQALIRATNAVKDNNAATQKEIAAEIGRASYRERV